MKQQKDALTIRSVNRDDVEELFFFFNSLSDQAKHFFHPHPFNRTTITQICTSQKDHYFVMLLHNKIIGYSMLRLFGYTIPSLGCCISPDHKGKGYGTKLVQWTVHKAKEFGYPQVILKVYKENIVAVHMYQKSGFTIIGEIPETKELKMSITFFGKKNNEYEMKE